MFSFLTLPQPTKKPGRREVLINPPSTILETIPDGDVVAVDIETCGVQAADSNCYVVGIGISSSTGTWYFSEAEYMPALRQLLLREDLQLVGHNIFFDSAFLTRDFGEWMPGWKFDTYGLFRQLANEGWVGQRYGLKDAQVDLLGWEAKGDEELNQWLVAEGHVKNADVYTAEKYTPEMRLQLYREGKCRPEKGMMYLAPPDILGYYCGLDAYSTRQLLLEVFLPSLQAKLNPTQIELFLHYHAIFVRNVKYLVLQQLRGIQIDLSALQAAEDEALSLIVKYTEEFREHPKIKPHLTRFQQMKLEEHRQSEPTKYKKLPELGQEPNKMTKRGEVSGAWLKWDEKCRRIEALGPGEVSKNWERWNQQHEDMKLVPQFNINSGLQRRLLFYDWLGNDVKVETKSGLPAVDKKALPGFGEPGKILANLDKSVKLISFISGLRERLLGDGVLHPQFKAPGTFTCRLGGAGKFNLQNIPKSAAFTRAFTARPGYVWVDLDFASLEQYVLAELSRDPALLKLYGPGAKANDVYLFVGSQLPVIGEKIRAAGYDPDYPTQEGIDKAKKEAKKERQIAKVIVLASSYGAGPGKIQATLELEGVKLTFVEAKKLHEGYWKLFFKTREYKDWVELEWEARGGWVFNGFGRPVCCYVDKKKDLVNRVVQSTGHDILMLFISYLIQLVEDAGLEAYPVFLDTHDASTWECREEDGPVLRQLFEQAMDLTNSHLMGTRGLIKLKGDAAIVRNLAEAKGL